MEIKQMWLERVDFKQRGYAMGRPKSNKARHVASDRNVA